MAVENQAALKAAYRFFDNDEIEENAILESHVQATYQRIKQVERVLAPQDTTFIDWGHWRQKTDMVWWHTVR